MDVDTLKKCSLLQLLGISDRLKFDINSASKHLVHHLVEKDKRMRKLVEMEGRLTGILIRYASENDLEEDIKFSIQLPQLSFDDYSKWVNGWKIVSRIGRGIPKQFRKRVWDCVTTYSTQSIVWNHAILFDSKRNSRDIHWFKQISETSYELKSKYSCHNSVESILIAYSRYNTKAEYTLELYTLSSLLLKIVEGDEQLALKAMICLIDFKLPTSYFTEQLDAVHLEIDVLNDLLVHMFPKLVYHLTQLQALSVSATIESYSSDTLPNLKETTHELPLTNAFVLRWFLFMFTHCLSWKSIRRLLDAVILCDADYFVYAGLAIWGVFQRDLLTLGNTSDYYTKVEELEEKLKNSQLMSSTKFMETVYAVSDVVQRIPDTPSLHELRQRRISLTPAHDHCPLPSEVEPISLNTIKDHTVNVEMPVLAAKAECPQTMRKRFFFVNAYAADIPNSVLAMYAKDTVKSHCQLLKGGKTYSIM